MNKQQYPNSPPPGRRRIEIVLKYKKMNIENIKSVYFNTISILLLPGGGELP